VPKDDISFLHSIVECQHSYVAHRIISFSPIVLAIPLGDYVDPPTFVPFKMNASHLAFEDCCTLVTDVWNLELIQQGENG
jgi:hypothetical protein